MAKLFIEQLRLQSGSENNFERLYAFQTMHITLVFQVFNFDSSNHHIFPKNYIHKKKILLFIGSSHQFECEETNPLNPSNRNLYKVVYCDAFNQYQ